MNTKKINGIKFQKEVILSENRPATKKYIYCVSPTGGCNIRSEPSLEADIIGRVTAGKRLKYSDIIGNWYQLEDEGFIHKNIVSHKYNNQNSDTINDIITNTKNSPNIKHQPSEKRSFHKLILLIGDLSGNFANFFKYLLTLLFMVFLAMIISAVFTLLVFLIFLRLFNMLDYLKHYTFVGYKNQKFNFYIKDSDRNRLINRLTLALYIIFAIAGFSISHLIFECVSFTEHIKGVFLLFGTGISGCAYALKKRNYVKELVINRLSDITKELIRLSNEANYLSEKIRKKIEEINDKGRKYEFIPFSKNQSEKLIKNIYENYKFEEILPKLQYEHELLSYIFNKLDETGIIYKDLLGISSELGIGLRLDHPACKFPNMRKKEDVDSYNKLLKEIYSQLKKTRDISKIYINLSEENKFIYTLLNLPPDVPKKDIRTIVKKYQFIWHSDAILANLSQESKEIVFYFSATLNQIKDIIDGKSQSGFNNIPNAYDFYDKEIINQFSKLLSNKNTDEKELYIKMFMHPYKIKNPDQKKEICKELLKYWNLFKSKGCFADVCNEKIKEINKFMNFLN